MACMMALSVRWNCGLFDIEGAPLCNVLFYSETVNVKNGDSFAMFVLILYTMYGNKINCKFCIFPLFSFEL